MERPSLFVRRPVAFNEHLVQIKYTGAKGRRCTETTKKIGCPGCLHRRQRAQLVGMMMWRRNKRNNSQSQQRSPNTSVKPKKNGHRKTKRTKVFRVPSTSRYLLSMGAKSAKRQENVIKICNAINVLPPTCTLSHSLTLSLSLSISIYLSLSF